MSVDERLQAALAPLGIPVSPNLYEGEELEYIVTNYQVIPEVYAERAPHAARYLVQIHYLLPTGANPNATLREIARAVWEAGLTWPGVVNASDEAGQHYVLECEAADGGAYYAQRDP